MTPVATAQAASSVLCSGYSSCADKGYSHYGYSSKQSKSYWRMYTGTNCTNYVAYRLVTTNGMPNTRPKASVGNAYAWGTAMASITDRTPAVGSVAWWGKTGHHVAYVEKIVSASEILVSESNWSGSFNWRRITKSGKGWPDGFIHFADLVLENTKKPTFAGTVKVGGTLTGSVGSWTPKPTKYSYRWLADGKTIAGATARTFTPTAAQLGKKLAFKIYTARPSYPTGTATSAATIVAPGALRATTRPAITGTPRVDATLTASPGVWTPDGTSLSYQWTADGTPIPGATTATFVARPQDAGRTVSVSVTAVKPGYDNVTTDAEGVEIAEGVLTSTAPPTISGTPRVGAALTARPGSWSRTGLTYAYRWTVADVPVEGTSGPTYRPTAADLGKTVSVEVTASRPGYTPLAAVSASTAVVTRGVLRNATLPRIGGTVRVGARLTATGGTWSPAADLTYQWYAGSERIAGATDRTFVVGRGHLGDKLRVRVVARRAGYTTAAAVSERTVAVAPGTISFSAKPTVTGTVRTGAVLTGHTGTYRPAGATVRLRWLRDGEPISGATTARYKLTAADDGARIQLRLTLSAPGYAKRTVHVSVTP